MMRWLFVVVLALAACGGEQTRLTGADLERALLSPGEAPDGTRFRPQESGNGLGPLGDTAEAQEALAELDIRDALHRTFASPQFQAGAREAQGRLVMTFGATFDTGQGAEEALVGLEVDILPRRLEGIDGYVVDGLGERAAGLAFDSSAFTPMPGRLILWQRANALFGVLVSARPDEVQEADLRALAERIDDRATQ